MPEKTKREKCAQEKREKEAEKPAAEIREHDQSNWGTDQLEKSYYYDDAHGYEIYKPDEDDDDEDRR